VALLEREICLRESGAVAEGRRALDLADQREALGGEDPSGSSSRDGDATRASASKRVHDVIAREGGGRGGGAGGGGGGGGGGGRVGGGDENQFSICLRYGSGLRSLGQTSVVLAEKRKSSDGKTRRPAGWRRRQVTPQARRGIACRRTRRRLTEARRAADSGDIRGALRLFQVKALSVLQDFAGRQS